jgi:hypothetical protein
MSSEDTPTLQKLETKFSPGREFRRLQHRDHWKCCCLRDGFTTDRRFLKFGVQATISIAIVIWSLYELSHSKHREQCPQDVTGPIFGLLGAILGWWLESPRLS